MMMAIDFDDYLLWWGIIHACLIGNKSQSDYHHVFDDANERHLYLWIQIASINLLILY